MKKLNLEQKKELVVTLKNKYDDKERIKKEYDRITNSVVYIWEDVDKLEDFVYDYIENFAKNRDSTLEFFDHLQWSINYKHYFYYYLANTQKYYYLENSRIVVECE